MPDLLRPSRRRFLALTTGFAGLAGCASLDGLGEIGGTTEGPGKAAILLPLTGEQAQFGKRLEAAVRLGGGPGIGIEIRDSGSSPDTAVIAAKAAEAAGANILIGPVFSAQTKTVAAAVNIPIVTLSNDTTLAGRNTFVFGVTPAQSARAVFALAAQRNIREIALVAPPGPLGARSAAEAVPIAQALGITLRPPVITDTPGTVLAELQAGGGLPDGVYLPSAGASLIPSPKPWQVRTRGSSAPPNGRPAISKRCAPCAAPGSPPPIRCASPPLPARMKNRPASPPASSPGSPMTGPN